MLQQYSTRFNLLAVNILTSRLTRNLIFFSFLHASLALLASLITFSFFAERKKCCINTSMCLHTTSDTWLCDTVDRCWAFSQQQNSTWQNIHNIGNFSTWVTNNNILSRHWTKNNRISCVAFKSSFMPQNNLLMTHLQIASLSLCLHVPDQDICLAQHLLYWLFTK